MTGEKREMVEINQTRDMQTKRGQYVSVACFHVGGNCNRLARQSLKCRVTVRCCQSNTLGKLSL